MDTKSLTDRATEIEATDATLRAGVNPATKDAWLDGQIDEMKRRFDFNGINIATADAVTQARNQLTTQYNNNLTTTVHAFEAELGTLDRDADAEIAAAEDIPEDPALTSAQVSDQVRLLADIAASLKRSDAERKLTGKTVREVINLYARTPDNALARVIEEQQLGGWREVQLARDEDADGILELNRAVAARRKARAAQQAPEAFAVKARIEKVKGSAVRDAVSRFVKHGHSLGVVAR